MRPPPDLELNAPEFPARTRWLNTRPLRMDRLLGREAALVEFWDFARVNSLRTLPYLKAWQARYSDHGLRVIAVHSPGYSFGRDGETVEAAVRRLDIDYAVALDPDLSIWRIYGNRGWPGRYLFDGRGLLRWIHYGEGDYRDTELAIHELLVELQPGLELPAPLEPLRPEDAPGALFEPQTADVALPRDRGRLQLDGRWSEGQDFLEAREAGARASVSFRGAGAFAVLSGTVEPGAHPSDGTVVAPAGGLRLHGFQFTPALAGVS